MSSTIVPTSPLQFVLTEAPGSQSPTLAVWQLQHHATLELSSVRFESALPITARPNYPEA